LPALIHTITPGAGPRIVVLVGPQLLTAGLALASLVTSLARLPPWFGVVVGIGAEATLRLEDTLCAGAS
jgi:hypothetical protein